MPVSEPLAVNSLTRDTTSAQSINFAPPTQAVFCSYASAQDAIDTISGHANNALTVLQFIDPASFIDPDVRDSLDAIRRRLVAIANLATIAERAQ